MQMAIKIEEREFGALDVYPDKLTAICASPWSDFRKPIWEVYKFTPQPENERYPCIR